MNGIKPKVVLQGKQYDEHTRRYMFFPLNNIDFAGSQFSSPIWIPKFPKGRIVLLESFPYKTQVAQDGEEVGVGSNAPVLGERIMGTDAQVRFLMGSAEGSGYLAQGMTYVESLTGVDPETASEVDSILIPNGEVPKDLIDFKYLFENLTVPETEIGELAKKALAEVYNGVLTSINFCNSYTSELEVELRRGQEGGFGMKSLSNVHKHYFSQIRKPLPEDRVGANMGKELINALAPLINRVSPEEASGKALEEQIEKDLLKKQLEEAQNTIKEQEEVISTLSNDTTEPKSN